MDIDGAGINVSRFLYVEVINRSIVDINFLCKIENRIILKGLLYCVNFISAISEKEYVVSIP